MPTDLMRIKGNVKKMIDQGAPESDIDLYIQEEGTTIDEVKNFKLQPESISSQGLNYVKEHPVKSLIESPVKTITGKRINEYVDENVGGVKPFQRNQEMYGDNPLSKAKAFTESYAMGLAGDIAEMGTAPINAIGGAITKVPGVKQAAGAIATTAPAKAVGRFLTKERIGTPKFLQPKEIRVNNVIDQSIDKAIRPSVSGKNNSKDLVRYKESAREGVKTIVENKDLLRLPDEAGQAVSRLPENLEDFSEAIHQTKSFVYKNYNNLVKQAQGQGASVPLNKAEKELDTIINNKALNIKDPSVIQYAKDLKARLTTAGELGVEDADELIQAYNSTLKAFYKNPTYESASRAAIDALVANRLRSSLDEVVTSATGKEFQSIKNQYGALKAIEKDVNRRFVVDARQNQKGLIDFTDIFSAGDVFRGITTMDPGAFAKGTAQMLIKNRIKALNNPNNIVKKMFAEVDRYHTPRPQSYIPEVLKPVQTPENPPLLTNQSSDVAKPK